MTTISTAQTARPSVLPIGLGCAAVGIGFSFLTAHDWGEIAIVSAVVAVATALVFGVVVPRGLATEAPGKRALALAIPALVLTLPAFWSGLPLVLGVGGVVLGNAGRNAPRHGGKAMAALVVGAIAVLGYLAIYVGDGLIAGHVGFLLD